jgi:hypothetical protein
MTGAGDRDFRRNDVVTTTALVVAAAQLVMYFGLLPWMSRRFEESSSTSDAYVPGVYAVWMDAAVVGLFLLFSDRTRRVGAGILLGTLGSALLLIAFFVFFVLPEIGS